MKVLLISYNTLGTGLSGGDRINIETVRQMARGGDEVKVIVWKEGADMYRRAGISPELLRLWPGAGGSLGTWIGFIGRILLAPWLALTLKKERFDLVWSASDALADTLPAAIVAWRWRLPWVAAFYLFAPPPWYGYRGIQQKRLTFPTPRELVFYLLQQITRPLIFRRARKIFVTGDEDRERIIALGRPPDEVFTVRGGVDLTIPRSVPDPAEKKYDAVFIGRFHPQKGVRELLDIWKMVTAKRPAARLALIGVGALESELRAKSASLGLDQHVEFLGFMDGVEKYRVVKASRVVVHPAIYDSGGMAAAEALACGLPGVAFDLTSLRSYYPRGFLKTPPGDLEAFASHIENLLADPVLYQKASEDAFQAGLEWDWPTRATQIINAMRRAIPDR